ncbi:MAG: formylglycine-generating enzyme family protein [Hyphomicrobiaceae bacterium]
MAWLSDQSGYSYRLLSEGRWEYARRSITKIARSDGAPEPVADEDQPEVGNVKGENWTAATTAVGSYRSNKFLLYDMMGNAGEWTLDCWQDDHSKQPKSGEAVKGTGDCTARAVRGGSWDEPTSRARPASRRKMPADTRDWRIGFRVMREIATGGQAEQ